MVSCGAVRACEAPRPRRVPYFFRCFTVSRLDVRRYGFSSFAAAAAVSGSDACWSEKEISSGASSSTGAAACGPGRAFLAAGGGLPSSNRGGGAAGFAFVSSFCANCGKTCSGECGV